MAKKKPTKKRAGEEPQPFFLGQEVTIEIDSLAYHSGHGVGRKEGFVLFVPRSAPGDLVRVRIEKLQSRFAEAKCLEVIKPSPFRRTPPCPVANRCGGCPWQHVEYDEQLRQKQRLLEKFLQPLLKVGAFPIEPLIPSPAEFFYRNRIQLQKRGQAIGYFASGSHELIAIEKCWIAELALNERIKTLINELNLSSQVSDESSILPDGRYELARLVSGEVRLSPRAPMTSSGGGEFSQVNEEQNKNLIDLVLNAAKSLGLGAQSSGEILDLYAGSGNFTLPLARTFLGCEVRGVELFQGMVERAQLAAKDEGLLNARFEASDVGQFLRQQKADPRRLIVLDPPRPGLDQVSRREIPRLTPAGLIYISCNPSTLVRDVQPWLSSYRIERAFGLDMFPQTAHLETVLILRRRDSIASH